MCVFRDIRGWRSSALQSPRLGTMAASPDVDSELMPSWFKFLSVYIGMMCCAFGLIGVTTRTTSRGTNTPGEEPGRCGALRACFTWIWTGQPGRPCWVTLLIKCLTLTCASTCSVAIGLLVTNISDSDDHSIAVTIKEILSEALGYDDNAGSRRRRAVYCVKPNTGTSGVLETWEPCQDEESGWQVNIEDQQTTSCSILQWLQATVDSSVPPPCVILLAQASMAAAVLVIASTISFIVCCSRKVTPGHSGREREAALEQGIQVGKFAYMRPRTPEEMTRARFWESCCAWMSPWILYPEEKESVEEITIDSTDKITDVAETRESREEQLPQDHTCTSSKADACTQVTPTVRFEDEATIEACPEASSPSQTPPRVEVTKGTTDQEIEVIKDTAEEL